MNSAQNIHSCICIIQIVLVQLALSGHDMIYWIRTIAERQISKWLFGLLIEIESHGDQIHTMVSSDYR